MAESSQPAYRHNGQPVSAQAFYAIACNPERHVAVEACAGAGKTWMLVSRIVRALLDGINPRDGQLGVQPHEILAITFTKRAASEMRERLHLWLTQFARADDSTLRNELEMRGVTIKNDSQPSSNKPEQLSNLYRQVLASGRQVQIRTFHSWFAALLRSAPVAVLEQMALPLNYELLEDDAPAKKLVWRRFFVALIADAALRADFEAVVHTHGRSQALKALEAALDKRVEFALADRQGVVDASVHPFSAMFPELAGLAAPAEALHGDLVEARWLARARALGSEVNKTPQKAAQSIVDAFALPPAEADARLDRLRKAFFVADEDRLNVNLQKFEAAQQAEPELQRLCGARRQHAAWQYQQRMARLARLLSNEFAALKRERGWVDMNDVEQAALVLLNDPVLSGWVQQRLDARIKHLLIDEFQDTNPLQWQALSSWLGSYAGSGGGSASPSVFIVGDPKQSIYRFRRAEPQVFRAAQAFVREGLGGDLLSCDHTRRNAQSVMAVVNAAMTTAREEDHYDGFREHTTSSTEAGATGKLPVIPRNRADGGIEVDGESAAADLPWRDSLTTPRETPEETVRTREARQVAVWIAGQVASGLLPQDIMVLSRKRAGLLPLQDELRVLGVSAQIGEKTDLIECCEVQDVVALLDVLVSPGHDLSLARALKSPLFGLPDEALVELALLRRQQPLSWWELLQKEELLTHIPRGLAAILMRWKQWLDVFPPHDALQSIYADGDVLARFAVAAPASQRDTVLANLRALLVMSLQLGGGRFATPYAFVRALKAGGVVAPAAVNPQAVRLLTIHGAKGLEAHTVLLLDTDAPERNADTMSVLVDWPGESAHPVKFVFLASESQPPACADGTLRAEQAERGREELNALYVALTRAQHSLVVSSIEPHRDSGRSWWQRLSALLPDLPAPEGLENGASPVADSADISASKSASFSIKELPLALVSIDESAIKNEANGNKVTDLNKLPDAAQTADDSASSRIGQAMHRLLEWGETSVAHAQAVAHEFALSAQQGEQARAMAQRMRAGPAAWVWDAAALAWQGSEVALVHAGASLRIDRLVQRNDTGVWWVLDYKSAHTPQNDPALVAQLHNYRRAVQAIYPDAAVHAAFMNGQGALIEIESETR